MVMKLPKNSVACVALAALGLAVAGCKTHGAATPIGGGYEEVSHPDHTYIAVAEPLPSRVSFQYRATDDTVTKVWPALYGVGEVVNDGVAVFVGDKAYTNPEKVTHPRVFAVKSPALPLDITDEVLREWAQATGRSLSQARDRFALATPEEKDGGVNLLLQFSVNNDMGTGQDNWPPQSILKLTWPQVDDIMHTVKSAGVEKKDLRWKTPYPIGEKL